MKKLFFLMLLIYTPIFTSPSWALPDWITPEVRRYPVETYLFDVGMSNATKRQSFEKAITEAHRQVAADIITKVAHIIQRNHTRAEYNIVQEYYSSVLEDYCAGRYAFPALKLQGFTHRNLNVDLARADHNTYALIYIDRNQLKEIYHDIELDLREKIKGRLALAKAADDALEINKAIKFYLQTYPLYESLKEAEIIQIAAEYNIDSNRAFQRMAASATEIGDNIWTHRQVIRRIERLEDTTIVNQNDIYDNILSQLTQQTHPPNDRVYIRPLIYKDSEIVSPLSQQFTTALQQKLPWTVVDTVRVFDQTPIGINRINQDIPTCRVSASFWMNGNEITIRTILRNVGTGEFLASSIVRFLKTDLRGSQNYDYTPPGYKTNINPEENDASKPRSYVIGPEKETIEIYRNAPIGGLTIDVWTNKGRDSILYHNGDKVQVYARVNQPAFLRILYTLADQRHILLEDNIHIGPDQVNKEVKIGNFICTEPFGRELLSVAARTEEFQDIDTINDNGFNILLEKDISKGIELYRALPNVYSDTRGLKKYDERQVIGPQPSFQQTEIRLTITTMKK